MGKLNIFFRHTKNGRGIYERPRDLNRPIKHSDAQQISLDAIE